MGLDYVDNLPSPYKRTFSNDPVERFDRPSEAILHWRQHSTNLANNGEHVWIFQVRLPKNLKPRTELYSVFPSNDCRSKGGLCTGTPAQEKGRGEVFSKWYKTYSFDITQYTNLFQYNELLKDELSNSERNGTGSPSGHLKNESFSKLHR